MRGHLRVEGAAVSYGGVRALKGLDLEVRPGSITGLIGPNGSGKTTCINAISGTQPAGFDLLTLDGDDLRGLPAHQRARRGLARTFQAIRLFDSLSVLDNVLLGATPRYATGYVGSILRTAAARRDLSGHRERAQHLLSTFGDRLLPRLGHQVATLSYANRRRVEITRALMAAPSLVLLDEPMAGMNPHETAELAGQLPELLAVSGTSALLIEHKMDVIARLCAHVYVLDHGECLAQGDPTSIQTDPAVVEAFLGVE